MANYVCASRTNYFRVTDEERYQELFQNLIGDEDNLEDFTKTVDGVIYHGFGTYGSVDYQVEIDEDGDTVLDFDCFLEELQKILPEKEAFMLFQSGHEKLLYVTGFYIVCTKNDITSMSLDTLALRKAKDLLGEDFTAQIDY